MKNNFGFLNVYLNLSDFYNHSSFSAIDAVNFFLESFKNRFFGIVFWLDFINSNDLNVSVLETFISYIFNQRKNGRNAYSSINLYLSDLNDDVIEMIIKYQSFLTINSSLTEIKKTKLDNYLKIKNALGIFNKGFLCTYKTSEHTYTEAFDYLYDIGYGYPIGLIPESDIKGEKLLQEIDSFLSTLESDIADFFIGRAESFFMGKSLESNLLRNLIKNDSECYRSVGDVFSPFVRYDGIICFNSLFQSSKFEIGVINKYVDFEKIKEILLRYKTNNNCYNCSINEYCKEFEKCGKNNFSLEPLVPIERNFLQNISCINNDIYDYLIEKQKSA